MKRKLGKITVNSLDLLLDTTSNVFGSMILIAIMIALFAGNPASTSSLKVGDITRDSIERQIKNAEKDASVLAVDLSQMKAKNGEKVGARELAQIQSDIDSIKNQIERAKKTQRDGVLESIVDYSATAAGAAKDSASIDQEVAQKQNAITAADQQIKQLKDMIQQLQSKVKKERAKKVQRISLPRERDTDQKHFWVIIINNEIFPSEIFDAGGSSKSFTTGINVIKKTEDSDLWTINRGKGYSFPNSKNDLIEQVRRLPRDTYVACIVFPDSIDAFRSYEEVVHDLGRDVGWTPSDMEKELIFTAHGGSHPKPK